MQYNRLGSSGLKISRLGLGSWLTFGASVDRSEALRFIAKAHEYGLNYFDSAEIYGNGLAEEIMGSIFKELSLSRLSYVVATKFYWGLNDGPNQRRTLNRKYLMHAINGSLRRLQTDVVDIAYCHRPDIETPLEETVAAMHDLICMGKILYWGTSEWSCKQIKEVFAICEQHNFRKPIVEQPQYNLLCRHKVEHEFVDLVQNREMGLITWSPLASGLLTGKYQTGIPNDSRFAAQDMEWLKKVTLTSENLNRVERYISFAKQIEISPTQLAIAWCLRNTNVSSVLLGASRLEQMEEGVQSMNILQEVGEEIWKEIEKFFSGDLIKTTR